MSEIWQNEFEIIFLCRFSVDGDQAYGRMSKDDREVIGNDIFYGAIRGTFDIARCDDIPQSEMMSENKLFFVFHGLRHITTGHFSDQWPEAVLGMSVKKGGFTGSDRRETAEDEYLGMGIEKRRDWMDNVL